MKSPKIETKVVHSQSKPAWNIVGVKPGGKYKIARVPYIVVSDDSISTHNRAEAFLHASFICICFNNDFHAAK